jgi:signal transduction histidine kinase/CHASE3 domain sensor protein/ActR/RegA family two-component response regulator
MKRRFAHQLGGQGLWASAVVIVVLGFLAYEATVAARASTQLVDRTVAALQGVNALSEALGRADGAQLGLLLTPDPRFLERRNAALDEAHGQLLRIQRLTAGEASQQARIHTLESLLAQRITVMQVDAAVRQLSAAGPGTWDDPDHEQSRSEIASAIDGLRETQLALLDERYLARQHLFRTVAVVLTATLGTCILLMIPGYVALRRQRRERSEAERMHLELTETLPGAVFQYRRFHDGQGRYEFLSGGFERLRGIDRAAALEDPEKVLGTVVEDDRPGLAAAIDASEKNGQILEHEYRARCPNGRILWIRTSAAVRRQPDGTLLWSGQWSDVTERVNLGRALQESKDAAEAASRAKTTFVATMSHEIRTPMNGVLGMLELLGRTELNPEQSTMLQVVRDSGKSLMRIIDEILDFSKIEAGKLDLSLEVGSVAKIVDGVYRSYANIAAEKGLSLTHGVDARIGPAVMCDALRLRQVLGNLVSNAIKFTAHGRVALTADLVERADGCDLVRFTVRDTGIGISEAEQKRLFQPFVQAGVETARLYGGTGLGLAICQRLVTLMGGSVGVQSVPGQGSAMVATIPFALADPSLLPVAATEVERATAPRRPAPTPAAAQADGTLLLIADDHPTNRMILVRQAHLLGYACEAADDGFQALDKWRSGRFGLLITDCDMPGMSGYELARHIRAGEHGGTRGHIPIIAWTAHAGAQEQQKCADAGMDDYLSKPADLKRLGEKLSRWLPIPEVPVPA